LDARRLGRLLWLALPMGVVTMLNALNMNVSRYFIAFYLGQRDLGVFATSASIIGVGRAIVSALGQAAYARLAQHYAANQHQQFRRVLLRLTAVAALVGAGGFVAGLIAGREILTLLFRAEYGERVDILHWLLAAGTLIYLGNCLGVGLTAARFFQVQVPMALFGICASVLSSWLLIPSAGLRGAAIAAVVAAGLALLAVFLILLLALRADEKHTR
jgi:O-antigen/teichoic acid export membrane protein